MIHLRIIVPVEKAERVLGVLQSHEFVTDLVHFPNCATKPAGDLITCHVPREASSAIVDALAAVGCDHSCSIALSDTVAVVSQQAELASINAAGAGADAVIWQAVKSNAAREAELSASYLLFIVIAGLLATIALLSDSLVLIIGAMVVGPEFGPLSAICVGIVGRDWVLAKRATWIVFIGFALAILVSFAAVHLLILVGVAAPTWNPDTHPLTAFVANPDAYAGIVAALAGIAGMLSLTTAHSGVLVGVFISVTTIPAAGNIALDAAYGNWSQMRGAAIQLGVNVGFIVAAGVATAFVQRNRYVVRFNQALAKVPHVLVHDKQRER